MRIETIPNGMRVKQLAKMTKREAKHSDEVQHQLQKVVWQ